eukprot:4510114-Prymnesium_polylepis.1
MARVCPRLNVPSAPLAGAEEFCGLLNTRGARRRAVVGIAYMYGSCVSSYCPVAPRGVYP